MRNVYLSVLGTNNDLRCIYMHEGLVDPNPKRFVQEATLQMFNGARTDRATSEDAAYFFLTAEAQRKNWLDGHYCDRETGQQCEGLESCLSRFSFRFPIRTIEIPTGSTVEEQWTIFDRISDVIRDEDRITFDVTHAFRSIPMFAALQDPPGRARSSSTTFF